MSITQIVLLILTILLFAMGLWPIAFLTTIGIIAIALHKKEEKKKYDAAKIQALENRIRELEKSKGNSNE